MSGMGLSGLASGFNTDAMVEKILSYESKKLTNQQIKKAQVEAKQDAWKQVRSQLNTLRSRLDTLRLGSTFQGRSATLSDASIASVSVTAGATMTTHSLEVRQLAQYHVVAGGNVADPNAQLNQTGTLTFTVGADTVNVTVAAADTLNSLRDKINNTSGINAKAEVVKVPNGAAIEYRLVLTAKNQGASGAVVLGDTDASDTLLKNLGFLKETAPASGVFVSNQLSAAQDADFTLNGVGYTSATNEVKDVLPGISITLKKGAATNNTTSITVERNTDSTVKSVEEWVKTLNASMDLLKEATQYNADEKTKGILNGDQLARTMLTNLRDMVSRQVTGLPAEFNRLSQVGITTGAYGTADYGKVVLDSAKLKEVVASNEIDVAKLFGAIDNNVGLSSAQATISSVTSTAAGNFSATDLINGDTDSARFGSVGGGWASLDAPSSAAPQTVEISLASAKTIESIRLFQPDNDTYKAKDTGLKAYKVEYWKSDTAEWKTLQEVTNHTGSSRLIEFDPVTTSKVRVVITGTYGTNNPARLSEIQVVAQNDGPAATMNRYLRSAFALSTGSLDTRQEALTTQVGEIGKQIDRIQETLTKREAQLRAQFARMEQAMAKMQGQSGYLQAMSQMMSSQGK